jgi:hypothetical protein
MVANLSISVNYQSILNLENVGTGVNYHGIFLNIGLRHVR